jgi:hypothetical protein
MNDLPASHDAKIYRARIARAEIGLAQPLPMVLARAKNILNELEHGDLARPIRLEHTGNGLVFLDLLSGKLIGSLDFDLNENN